MAEKKVLVNLNFNGNQIIDVRAEVAPSAPATASPGRFYFNSQEQKLYIYTTGGWKQVGVPDNAVTGSGLTLGKVILGSGNNGIQASQFTIEKSVPSNAVFTDTSVVQDVAPNTNGEFPVLFSKQEWLTGNARTGGTYISQHIKFNPNTGALSVKKLAAADGVTINGKPVATEDYVNAQDAKINDRISNISGFGRYLSGWDMATGEPASVPTTASYTLRAGDYFVINNVPSSGTKYKPNQTGTWQTDQSFAKTPTSESCVVGGYWKYDGSSWGYFKPESAVTLPSFTNNTLGGIKGHEVNGYVYHVTNDTEGYGMVYGWATKADTDTTHTITLQGDVTTVSGSHKNGKTDADVTISVTIANGAVTEVKIANGAVTRTKIADDAVDYTKLAAKAAVVGIVSAADHSSEPNAPYWASTGNANEYSAHAPYGATRNGTIRLCDGNLNEVECVYEYGSDETGIYDCTVYINSATAPTSYAYYFLCRKE